MKNALTALLFAVALCLATTNHVSAQRGPNDCRLVKSGFGYVEIAQAEQNWRYTLRPTLWNWSWSHAHYGYHATGMLTCKSCRAGGLYHFATPSEALRMRIPRTSAARIARSQEGVWYPTQMLGSKDLAHRATREPIQLGTLTGYAVLYDVPGPTKAWLEAPRILVVQLTDNCLIFETTMTVAADLDEWSTLDSLLKTILIEKTRAN